MQGNSIGTDPSGTLARGNSFEGVYMQEVDTNLIGGSPAGAGNLISGNGSRGIWLTDLRGMSFKAISSARRRTATLP